MGRTDDLLCGAWTLEHDDVDALRTVIARGSGLASTAGRAAVDKAGASLDVSLDLSGARAAVDGARTTVRAAFDVAQKKRPTERRPRISTGPDVPTATDLDNPPVADAPPLPAGARGVTRSVGRLVEMWDETEDIRTSC